MSNPIYSHDLYTPGGKDMLALLKQELVAIQSEIRATEAIARQLKKTLSEGKATPAQVVAAATQAEKIASQKRLLLARENAQAQRIHNTTLKQQAIHEQQVAAATSRANVARQREIDYANRAATANKSHSSSLKGLIGSIRNLAYAYFSLGAATQVFQSILKQTKALDTLTVAFNTTLGSTQATAQAQEYLLDISERFGANLLGASQAYLKFSAASTQAGVSAEETQKIFTSVTKASSILGLGAERTSYVFLALEQIMSKGRLSTEELRRQLGEHLPGAFGIMADALSVTTAKLTDMLKKGEILSTDALPKFARQIEKAYGIDKVERIDNLAAAQERFNSQLTLLTKDLDLSDAFKDLFNNLAEMAKWLAQNASGIVALTKVLFQLGLAWAAWKVAMIATNQLQAVSTALLGRSIRMHGLFATATALAARAVRTLSAAIAANPLGAFLTVVILLWPQINKLADSIRGVSEGARAMQDSLDDMRVSVIGETEAVKKQIAVLGDLNSTQAERLAAFNDLQASYPGILNSYDLEKIALGDLVTLEQQLTTAITERAKASRKAQIEADLLKSLEEANRAKPFGLLLNSKEGANQQTINFRENLRQQAFTLAEEKLNALDQASLDLNKFLQEQIKAGDTVVQMEALRLQYRAKEVELQEKLNALSDDELLTILEKEKAKGRSFGQVDPFFDLRKKIANEVLVKRKKPEDVGDPDGKTKKNTFDAEKERLDLILNNQERELAGLKLAYERKKADFIANKEDTNALEEKYQYDRSQIINKYLDIEIEAYLDAEEEKRAAFKKATEDVVAYLDERRQAVADAETKRQANVDFFRDEFKARREHEKAIFDLTTHTKEETLAFELKLKEDELNDELQLHRTFGKVLSDEEVKRVTELRDRTKAARIAGGIVGDLQGFFKDNNGSDKKEEVTDIFSLLGIDFGGDDEKLDAFKQTIAFVGGELSNFLDFQKEIVDQQIENADRLVRNAENNLTRQIELQVAGQANNVAGAQAELALAKKTQEEALKQRRKTQRQELALDTLSQSSNLITAVTAALKLGPILGPIAVGAILATFAVSKIKALQLINKKTFRKGGFREIGGGSHESGNDTHVGGNNWAEKDESVGIFTAKATRKYKPSLKAIVNAANKGTLENILVQDRRAIQGINMTNRLDVDTSLMEKRLTRLVSLSETKTFVDGRGRLVRIDRGRTTIINK